jgi:phage gp29-like protein
MDGLTATGANLSREPLTQEIATVERDFHVLFYGGMMRPNDDTLLARGGGLGLKIYDDIERDSHAYAVIQKRKMAIVSRDWTVEAASSGRADKKAADMVKEMLTNMGFDFVSVELLDAILKGFSVGEIMWARDGALLVPTEMRPRDQRRFAFTTKWELRMRTREHLIDGVELPDRKFIVHRFGAKDGNPFGLGLGNKLFWPTFFKRQDLTFWLTYADKYGSPTAIGKYPAGSSVPDQDKLLATLGAISQEAGVIIPEGMIIELLEAARSGSAEHYERLARYMDEQISEAVLGETLSTNTRGGGSHAAAKTHNEVRQELTRADEALLSDTLNKSLVPWIIDLNMPDAARPKLRRVMEDPEDLDKRATRDEAIYAMGFEPTEDYIRETYGEGWVKRKMDTPFIQPPTIPQPSKGSQSDFAEDTAIDVADRYADQASGKAPAAMAALLGPIHDLVEHAGSIEEIRDGLLDLYPLMDGTQLAGLMQRALAAGSLAGRYEVSDGR